VASTLRSLGRGEGEISADQIEAVCKHAGYLKVLRYRSLEEEYSSPRTKFIRKSPLDEAVLMLVEGEFENTLIHYYLALRAYDRFLQKYNRPPGSTDDDEDLAIMTRLVDETLGDSPANVEMVSNACAEM
jgi:amyloid beta precursor protein binding protein 1